MILVDTNVLARFPDGADPLRGIARTAVTELLRRQEILVVAPQCLYEFWVVMTRPIKDHGYEFSPVRAGRWLHRARHLCKLLPDDLSVCDRWENLVVSQNVLGKKGHDAHLAAWMLTNKVDTILTFNAGDFARFGINVVNPRTLLAGPLP